MKCEHNLSIMVHHYSNPKYLFRTVISYREAERERILDRLTESRTWYWGRFSPRERADYMKKRLLVEKLMYDSFSSSHWRLRDKVPVYFYIYPDFSVEKVEAALAVRREFDELRTGYLLVDLNELNDLRNITFTILDSIRSYRTTLEEYDLPTNYPDGRPPNDGYGRVFHISEREEVHRKCCSDSRAYFEVQVWDRRVLADTADRLRTRRGPWM